MTKVHRLVFNAQAWKSSEMGESGFEEMKLATISFVVSMMICAGLFAPVRAPVQPAKM
mgnify:CR=1 FL=1